METLQDLLEERAVIAIGLRYAEALDGKDFALLLTCFTPYARWGTTQSMAAGHAEIAARAEEALRDLDATQHVTTNFQVRLEDDRARMRSYYLATHVRRAHGSDPPHYVVAGRYDDALVRTPGGWAIAERRLTGLWSTGDPAILGAAFAAKVGLAH